MRVVLNRLPTLGARTGIGHYVAELIAGLDQCADGDEIHVFPTGLLWQFQKHLMGSGSGKATWGSKALGWARSLLWVRPVRGVLRRLRIYKTAPFQVQCRQEKYDLYHEGNILPLPCDVPTVSTFHDLSAIAHPEWHPADRVHDYERNLDRALSQCVHFLTGSDCTRQEIITKLGVAPERVTRVYHGIRHGLAPMPAEQVAAGLKALNLPPSYLLHVGTLEPRKNLDMLARAYCTLPDAVRQRCPLLLVGKWGWNTSALAAYLDSEARQRGVIHLGYLAEEHLPLLFNGARALVYPSMYEGFGLPPLEMMACGGAVLASTAGAVAEVVGPRGQLIDFADADGWREAMQRVIVDDDWHRELRRGVVEWAAPFTWRRCAENTWRAYRSVLGLAQETRPGLEQAA